MSRNAIPLSEEFVDWLTCSSQCTMKAAVVLKTCWAAVQYQAAPPCPSTARWAPRRYSRTLAEPMLFTGYDSNPFYAQNQICKNIKLNALVHVHITAQIISTRIITKKQNLIVVFALLSTKNLVIDR